MGNHAGIARTEESLAEGLARLQQLQKRAEDLHIEGSRLYNPSWHTARDDLFMLTLAEAILRCALERKESRGAHWRTDYPDKDAALGSMNYITTKTADGMKVVQRPIPPMPAELAAVVNVMESTSPMSEITLNVFRGDASGGAEQPYQVPVTSGMVVLDAIHYIQAHLAGDLACRWNCKAAKCGSCSAEINGHPRLMCKTRVDEFEGQEIHVYPMRTFPLIKDLVTDVSWNYTVNKQIAPLTPAPDDGKPWVMHSQDVERLYEYRKCIECFLCQDVCHVLREHDRKDAYFGPRYFVRLAYYMYHPKDTLRRLPMIKKQVRRRYVQHYQVLLGSVPGAHSYH